MADRELLKRVAEVVREAYLWHAPPDVLPDMRGVSLDAIIDCVVGEAEAQQSGAVPVYDGKTISQYEAKATADALAAAHARGVIAGLEIALGCFPRKNSATQWYAEDEIRAEIERRRVQGEYKLGGNSPDPAEVRRAVKRIRDMRLYSFERVVCEAAEAWLMEHGG